MTEPTEPRPVPSDGENTREDTAGNTAGNATEDAGQAFDDLDQRPVAEHVAVFEAEHARLERELGTIDRL
jgi:hypothetical protein